LSGSAAYHLGQPEKAKGLLEAGIALSDTHNIGTMQKYLYADYALTLESLGEYKNALLWQKKKFALEIEAERSAAVAREELFNAETRARESYKEVMSLRRENEVQREILVKDNRIKRQLALIVMSLSLLAAILTYLFRSLRINQAKLIESENKAQSANKAKSEFLANMSHEIRTPLNGVLGMLQLLQRTNLNEQQKYYTDIMYKSGDSLITVISDILDFSKIEDNKLLLDPVPGDLHSTVKAVTDLFTPKAKEKNLALIFNYDPSLPGYLMYDETRLRVTGTARPNDQEADVIIEVRDTGIGIPEEKISMIFEKFTQAKGAATTSKFGGSGLGLAISLRLAQAMNGTLEAHSEPGRGAIFTVKLPLKIAANPAQNKSKNAFEEERAILTKRLG